MVLSALKRRQATLRQNIISLFYTTCCFRSEVIRKEGRKSLWRCLPFPKFGKNGQVVNKPGGWCGNPSKLYVGASIRALFFCSIKWPIAHFNSIVVFAYYIRHVLHRKTQLAESIISCFFCPGCGLFCFQSGKW